MYADLVSCDFAIPPMPRSETCLHIHPSLKIEKHQRFTCIYDSNVVARYSYSRWHSAKAVVISLYRYMVRATAVLSYYYCCILLSKLAHEKHINTFTPSLPCLGALCCPTPTHGPTAFGEDMRIPPICTLFVGPLPAIHSTPLETSTSPMTPSHITIFVA